MNKATRQTNKGLKQNLRQKSVPTGPKCRRSKVMNLIPLIVFFILTCVFAWRIISYPESIVLPSALLGKPAPKAEFIILTLSKNSKTKTIFIGPGFFKNKVTLVNVWASWCIPCREEHSLLMQLSRDHGIQILGINYKDSRKNARKFIAKYKNPFTVIVSDPGGEKGIEWGIYGVPESFLVGKEGKIIFKHVGPLTPDVLENQLLPLIEKNIGKH